MKIHQSLSRQGMKEILALQLRKIFDNELSLIFIMCSF